MNMGERRQSCRTGGPIRIMRSVGREETSGTLMSSKDMYDRRISDPRRW